MRNKDLHDNKHLTLENRKVIEESLDNNEKLKYIAFITNKDDRTISKEIERNRELTDYSKKRLAWNKEFKDFSSCKKLEKYPFVCNGCSKKHSCFIDHYYYDSKNAQIRYEHILTSSRQGIDLTNSELIELDALIKDGTKKGQSIYAICESNKDKISKSPNTIYSYVEKGILSTSPIDLRRATKMKPRIKSNKYSKTKDERNAYINRTIDNYYNYLINNPGTIPVQMDTVEGSSNSTKFLFTIHIPLLHFMFIFLINSQTSNEIKRVLDEIEYRIGLDNFRKIFGVILTDRGKEFLDPDSFELSIDGVSKRTNIFYCDPMVSNQKSEIEKNHTLIRYVIPKGSFMDNYTDNNILLLTSTINSYKRKEIGGKCPYDLFSLFYDEDILTRLFIDKVEPNDINLTPSLLTK